MAVRKAGREVLWESDPSIHYDLFEEKKGMKGERKEGRGREGEKRQKNVRFRIYDVSGNMPNTCTFPILLTFSVFE